MANEPLTRNWAAEAAAIASGESQIIPEREHVQALAAHAEASIAKTLKMGSILTAFLVDEGLMKVHMPAACLDRVKGFGVAIEPLKLADGSVSPDGTLEITVVKPSGPPRASTIVANPSKRVQ